jgi:hypothetical protein
MPNKTTGTPQEEKVIYIDAEGISSAGSRDRKAMPAENNSRTLVGSERAKGNYLPRNSQAVAVPERRQLSKVVTGQVVMRKKSFGDKLKSLIIGDDSRSVLEYIVQDVLIPSGKAMLYDIGNGALEMRLYGSRKGTRTIK